MPRSEGAIYGPARRTVKPFLTDFLQSPGRRKKAGFLGSNRTDRQPDSVAAIRQPRRLATKGKRYKKKPPRRTGAALFFIGREGSPYQMLTRSSGGR